MRFGVFILLVSFVWSLNLSGQVSREELKQFKLGTLELDEITSQEIFKHFNQRSGGGEPEQDCNGAIPVCLDTYTQDISYSGEGQMPEEVGGGNCLLSGELNSVWYIWTVTSTGTLEFIIDPVAFVDDYDFAVYNITGLNCSNVPNINPVRCNYSAADGPTGLSASASNDSESAGGPPFSNDLNVTVGQTYVLVVSNFSSTTSGYGLTFSGSSEIFDETPPEPQSVLTPCGVNFIEVTMSEAVLCNSITELGTEFELTGPGGPFTITGATGVNCGLATAQIVLDLNTPVIIGETYTLTINNGTDGNTVIDNCGNELVAGSPSALTFVAVPNEATIAGPTITCAGSPITLTVSEGLEYLWSNGETTQSITVSPTEETTYSVTVTSGTCVQSANQTVAIRPSPIASFNFSPATVCEGQVVSFTSTSDLLMSCLGLGLDVCTDNSECAPFSCNSNITSFSYNFDDGSTSSSTNPNHIFSDPGTYNVSLTVEDFFNGCSNEIIVPINVLPDGGDLTLTGEMETCAGDPVELVVAGGSTYAWTSDPPGFTSTDETITVSPAVTTTYTVSTPGCMGDITESITVNVTPLPDVNVNSSAPSICFGLTATLSASGALNYTWSPPNGLNMTTGAVVEASPSTTTTYTVEGKDAVGCSNTATVVVEVVDGITTEISADAPLEYCGDKVDISVNLDAGSGFVSYLWSDGSTSQVLNAGDPGDYFVTVADAAGCIAIDTITIVLLDEIIAQAGDDTEVCLGESVNLSASGGFEYEWSPAESLSDPDISDPVATPTATTTYQVSVSYDDCFDTDEVVVKVNPLPVIIAGTDTTIIEGESVELSASGGIDFSWSPVTGLSDPDIANPIASPTETTTYTVTVTDDKGCISSAMVTITVDDRECPLETLFIPNAFSPNGDGQNDVLYVRLQDSIDRMSFRIYNRWGELVFETDDITEGWDGRYDGEVQTTGVFAYFLEIQCGDEMTQEKGNITIVR